MAVFSTPPSKGVGAPHQCYRLNENEVCGGGEFVTYHSLGGADVVSSSNVWRYGITIPFAGGMVWFPLLPVVSVVTV